MATPLGVAGPAAAAAVASVALVRPVLTVVVGRELIPICCCCLLLCIKLCRTELRILPLPELGLAADVGVLPPALVEALAVGVPLGVVADPTTTGLGALLSSLAS